MDDDAPIRMKKLRRVLTIVLHLDEQSVMKSLQGPTLVSCLNWLTQSVVVGRT